MMVFFYGSERVEIQDLNCNLTVLEWLREHRRKTGTKEGCASGDCGACTVVIATPAIDSAGSTSLSYSAVNSCITFLGALHGKQLLSVESLAEDTGDSELETLHPVQQAMVDAHGSQCGFCTPGFIMSMYALYKQGPCDGDTEQQIEHALSGNLCRCTGYRPIRQAAIDMLLKHAGEHTAETDTATSGNPLTDSEKSDGSDITAQHAVVVSELGRIAVLNSGCPSFVQPRSLKELATLCQEYPNYRLLGGGTDLALEVTQELRDMPGLIHLGSVPELQEVSVQNDRIILGSAVTVRQCLECMTTHMPGATSMLLRFGSAQIRNQATVGGNLATASPIGDLSPLLLACDAVLTLQCGVDIRQLPIGEFFLGYRKTALRRGEFIVSVQLPIPARESLFSVYKVSKRRDDDISSVCLAAHLPQRNALCAGVRLAYGGVAATPVRATLAEAAFEGQVLDAASVVAAAAALEKELRPISDARASADYRMIVAQNLLRRLLPSTTVS